MDQDVREFFEQMAAMMSREFARINGRFDGVDSRLDRVEARLDRVEARLDRIEARLDSHDRRLDRLETQYHDIRLEMRSGFAQVQESIGALTVRVEALEYRA